MVEGIQSAHILHRLPKTPLRTAVSGDGPYIIDSEGRRYFDASGGAAVSCLGHSHPKVIATIEKQVRTLPFVHTSFFTAGVIEELGDLLVADAPGDLDRVYFTAGGSEAMEAALKLARQYFVERGEPKRSHIIARRQSYHGNTLGALATGGNLARRIMYEPLLTAVSHIAPCYTYRERLDDEAEGAYGLRVADELATEIERVGPENVMCFVAETIPGATLGCALPTSNYFRRIREICDRSGVLLILDEVMCGMGRTGTMYACEEEGIAPDILTIAKGLGAGYQPIGAVLASSRIFDALLAGSGILQHGHTYNGHLTACAAAFAVQTVIREDNLLEAVRARGEQLRDALNNKFGNHPHIGDIRGKGLFWALEIVKDRTTKQPFVPQARIGQRLKGIGLDNGILCYPSRGTADGICGDHVMLAPPYIVTSDQIPEIVHRLGISIEEAIRTARAS